MKEHAEARADNKRIRIMVNHIGKRMYEKEKSAAAAYGRNEDDNDTLFPLLQETTESICRLDSFDSIYGHAKDFNDANKQIKECEEALRSLDA